jgi:DNA primase catalytic subunit
MTVDDPHERYGQLIKAIKADLKPNIPISTFETEFIIGMLYPKLDVEVTSQTNHLLKMPFNIHPDTLNICVPIFDFKTFNPEECLNLEDFANGATDIWSIKGKTGYSF